MSKQVGLGRWFTALRGNNRAFFVILNVSRPIDNANTISFELDINSKPSHPLKYHFQAETIQRYPEKDWSDGNKYPTYVPMVFFDRIFQKI